MPRLAHPCRSISRSFVVSRTSSRPLWRRRTLGGKLQEVLRLSPRHLAALEVVVDKLLYDLSRSRSLMVTLLGLQLLF